MTRLLHLPDDWQVISPSMNLLSSREAADEKIRQFETDQELLQYSLDNWSIWPVLRFSVFARLEGLQAQKPVNPALLGNSQRIKLAVGDIQNYLSLSPVKIACLVQSSNRSEKIGAYYKDIYFDDLLLELESYVKIENLVNQHYLLRSKQALVPSKLTTAAVQLAVGALLKGPIPGNIRRIAEQISQKVQPGLELPDYSTQRISTMLANFHWSKSLYKIILKRIKPRCLLLTTAYMYHAPVAAAKELGIPVIEFQHGMVDLFHNGYSWSQAALPYKKSMPVPDKLFLYGDHWVEVLKQRGFWQSEPVPAGSLRMDYYRQLAPSNPMRKYLHLLVTTQDIDIQDLIDYFVHFCRLAENTFDFRLTFKLHPGEHDKSRYQAAFAEDRRVDVLLGSEDPSTYQLLADSDWHISIYSTCHYEAIALGVPTIILPFSNHQIVMHLDDASSAFFAPTPERLVSIIQQNPNLRVPAQVGDHYFKSGALENMQQELAL